MLANSILQACVQWDRCEDSNKEIRDGSPQNVNDAATDTSPDNGATIAADNQGARRFGYHEPHEWYTACKTRSRNRGLFIADRRLNKRDARSTRQNNNGNRRGLECPEERDYYPYWTPTPWRDIAVLVDDVERCDYYKNNSNNVKKYGECLGGTLGRNQVRPITETECVAMGFKWHEAYAANSTTALPKPDCKQSEWSRDNHLGNGIGGWDTSYNWTIPDAEQNNMKKCVLRLRYNISTSDYPGLVGSNPKHGSAFFFSNADNARYPHVYTSPPTPVYMHACTHACTHVHA